MEVLVLGGLAAAHRNPCPNGDHLPVFIPPELYFYGDTQFWGLQQICKPHKNGNTKLKHKR